MCTQRGYNGAGKEASKVGKEADSDMRRSEYVKEEARGRAVAYV